MMRILVLFALSNLARRGFSQDVMFPKDEEISYLSGDNPVVDERIPVYIPMRCGENMLLYPGAGKKSTWSCDCKPGFLYFPFNNTCHEAYKQGPCASGHYVYLPSDNPIPRCVLNPCIMDGLVPYKGVCQALGASCHDGIVKVNSTTFAIECIPSAASPNLS